jgi:predicted nicotinamide N-methyase
MKKSIPGYRLSSVEVDLGGFRLNMLVVGDLHDHVDPEALLRDENAPEPPYWALLWPGSRVLARLLATELHCTGRRVVDIGCGLGLTAVTAAVRGGRVVALDTATEALQLTRANARRNGVGVDLLRTDVRAPALRAPFDIGVAADVTYDPALQAAVASFFAAHLQPGGIALCAESVRTLDQGFRTACEERGLHVTEREVREIDDGRTVVVRISEVRRQ